jgi:hypothetical protein
MDLALSSSQTDWVLYSLNNLLLTRGKELSEKDKQELEEVIAYIENC